MPNGDWLCEHWQSTIPLENQLTGCDQHLLHPDLVPGWSYQDGWITPKGLIADNYSSHEIIANWQACAVAEKGIETFKEAFNAKVVG
jgi:hypothetical protein